MAIVYKLLVDFQSDPPQPVEYQNYSVTISLTNIGETLFPGGEIILLCVIYGVDGEDPPSEGKHNLTKIPPIAVNEEVTLPPVEFWAVQAGPASINFAIEPDDSSQLSLFQNRQHDMGKTWVSSFHIKSESKTKEWLGRLKERCWVRTLKSINARGKYYFAE